MSFNPNIFQKVKLFFLIVLNFILVKLYCFCSKHIYLCIILLCLAIFPLPVLSVHLIYVAPEVLLTTRFKNVIKKLDLKLLL